MGREIRRVPPNWEHPKGERRHGQDYLPKHDRNYEQAAREWIDECVAWSKGEHSSQTACNSARECKFFWEWDGPPPEAESHLDYDPGDKALCTWWQCYETMSEGTPVSPAFATAEELVDYLSSQGDFWEQRRAAEEGRAIRPSSRENLERFVNVGHAFSMVVTHKNGQTEVAEGIDTMTLIQSRDN